MKRVAVLAGAVLVLAGASLMFGPLTQHDASGRATSCGPPLVRVLGKGSGQGCDLAAGFVLWGGVLAAIGVAVILITLFAARPLAATWHRAIDQGRAASMDR